MMATRKTILVADDSEGIRNVVQLMLEPVYDIVVTGTDVRKHVQDLMPDLVLLDVSLQGEDGVEISRRLKSVAATRSIPILLLSAAEDLGALVTESGADGFIQKPFEMRTLQETVHQFIGA